MIFITFLLLLVPYVEMSTEWIDPHDMLNFDRSTMSHSKHTNSDQPKEQVADSIKEADTKSQNTDVEETVKKDEVRIDGDSNSHAVDTNKIVNITENEDDSQETKTPSCPSHRDTMFFRVFTKRIIETWKNKIKGDHIKFHAVLAMSLTDLLILENFTSPDDRYINDAHDVLSKMIVEIGESVEAPPFDPHEQQWLPVNFFIRHSYMANWGLFLVMSLLVGIHIARMQITFSLKQVLLKFILVSFVLSIPMTWYHMYKQEEAKQVSASLTVTPKGCHGEDMTSWELFVGYMKSTFTFKKDECLEYQEIVHIPAVFKVSITEAIAMTVVKMFIKPLSLIGEEFGKFIANTMASVPIFYGFVPIFVLLFLVLIIFGYSFRIPYIFEIAPSRSVTSESTKILNQLEGLEKKLSAMEQLQNQHRPTYIERLAPSYSAGLHETSTPFVKSVPNLTTAPDSNDLQDTSLYFQSFPQPHKFNCGDVPVLASGDNLHAISSAESQEYRRLPYVKRIAEEEFGNGDGTNGAPPIEDLTSQFVNGKKNL